MPRLSTAALISLLAAGCATIPVALQDGPFADLTPRTALEAGATGQRVRWGGEIVAVNPRQRETCFEILSRPLDSQARPERTDETYGRFLACADGFFDPAAYPVGREMTFIGTVQPAATLRIGEYRYQAPRLDAQRQHLWPQRMEVPPYPRYYDPFWDPWWHPWPYYRWPYHPYFW